MKIDTQTYRLSDAKGTGTRFLIMGVLALILSALGYFTDSRQFFYSYLVAYVFWVSLALGGLFFVMLNHLTGTVWGLVLRRITETVMIVLPYMFIFFIPIIFGMHDLYHWSHADVVAGDELLQTKSGYLNIPFFIIRTVIYFALWYIVAYRLYKLSLAQDEKPTPEQINKMRRTSGPGMVIFALTSSFAAFDWLMSLDPHWYSTIYGVYIFSGGLLSILAFLVLMGGYLRGKKILGETITIEHYHDLAKLLFSFTIFWGYMAFSQYFLIWYANIPEETVFFLHRWEGSWKIFTMVLVFGNFLIPFFGLMTRAAKRNLVYLRFMALWIMVTHWIDLYWNAVPNLHHHGIHLSWMDLTLFLGIGGVFLFIFWKHLSAHALVPVGDPKLQESIEFQNT